MIEIRDFQAQAFTRSRQDQTLAERPNIFEKL